MRHAAVKRLSPSSHLGLTGEMGPKCDEMHLCAWFWNSTRPLLALGPSRCLGAWGGMGGIIPADRRGSNAQRYVCTSVLESSGKSKIINKSAHSVDAFKHVLTPLRIAGVSRKVLPGHPVPYTISTHRPVPKRPSIHPESFEK